MQVPEELRTKSNTILKWVNYFQVDAEAKSLLWSPAEKIPVLSKQMGTQMPANC